MGVQMEKVDRLTRILLQLNKDLNAGSFSQSQRDFLAAARCTEIAMAQQNVLATGVGTSQLWQMWRRNSEFLPDQAAKLRAELPANHVLRTVLAEHELTLCFIADLADVNARLQKLFQASSKTMEVRKLAHIAEHLVSSEQHRQREDEIIFPELISRGFNGPFKLIKRQHRHISKRRYRLKRLVWQIDRMNFDEFKYQLAELVDFLVPTIRMHIFIESNVIFPLALEIIDDQRVWNRIKDICDQIGYCGCERS